MPEMPELISQNIARDLDESFPWLNRTARMYIVRPPIRQAALNLRLDGHRPALEEAFERLLLAQYLHHLPDPQSSIIAGDYFYASGIDLLNRLNHRNLIIEACKAIKTTSFTGYEDLKPGKSSSAQPGGFTELIELALVSLVEDSKRPGIIIEDQNIRREAQQSSAQLVNGLREIRAQDRA